MKRSVFFISDGTGITAETLGHSLLAQFGVWFLSNLPYLMSIIPNALMMRSAKINAVAAEDGCETHYY